MRNRLFILLLSALLAAPALAQQSNIASNIASNAPAGSANQSASSTQPASREDFWDGEEPSFGALLLHPFATKEYVRRHVQPIRDRLNELEEMTEANRKMTRDVDARAQQGIQLASAKVNLADEHATDATSKAQTAHQATDTIATRLTTDEKLVGNIDQFKAKAQTDIRFRPGQTVLSKEAKDALDEMAAPLKNQHAYIIEVQGFASGQGQAAIANSRKIADAVVRYLVLNHEIPAYRIYVLGLGNASATKGTHVEINLLKNDLDQMAKQ
jgi:outer membrane protein OmpA-like peptidoglycan-associated protein